MAVDTRTTTEAAKQRSKATPQDDLDAAYRLHTLACALSSHLGMAGAVPFAESLPMPMSGAGIPHKEEPMFWNDPNMYGATLPYREVPTHLPHINPFMAAQMQWPIVPRFAPPTFYGTLPQPYGTVPQPYNFPLMNVDPFANYRTFPRDPFLAMNVLPVPRVYPYIW
jgi:hypothetical protein